MNGILWAMGIGAALSLAWWVSLWRRPWKTCRVCGGRKRLPGFIEGTHGDCRRCGATGRVRRFGAGEER